MRVVIDTRNMGQNGGTGIATYARMLSSTCEERDFCVAWLNAQHRGKEVRSGFFGRFGRSLRGRRRPLAIGGNYEVADLYRTAVSRYRIFSKVTILENDAPPDIMHWSCPLPLRWNGVANIVTIHDLIPMLHPTLAPTVYGNIRKFLQDCCDNASAIVTVSEAVRDDILCHLDVPAAKVVNLSQAVSFDVGLMAAAEIAEPICPEGGFLYFGLLERRKNLVRLIRAHGQSRSRRPLTLIGTQGHGGDEILAERERHPEPERVRIIPWARREQLLRAIKVSRAVVFPSLAEGFGLPIIEAMLLGTPVLTSRGHATEEVAGGSALLVDPLSTAELVRGLIDLDEDEALIDRMKIQGAKRAASFSTAVYGERLAAFYRNVATL
ncbi:glycosyltransferase family 4 protein [Brytella acorum]|uniref:Glycosyltransferase family 1 protein n=1 Tax=Brytella acorum TaxID=2959299 RepID=A0AA35UFQ7_9PROT|nr:glycosyltransferase family 1 protein [Brytella acorum]MDF3625481.1 glycosyltransferase family 1 protein [Brytella acorum]CAI9120333.1 glycosyltransferase family 1 protein [Brytella acorum]